MLVPELERITAFTASRQVQRLDETPMVALYAIYCQSHSASINRMLEKYAASFSKIHPLTDGYTLQSLGVEPGPVYRQILWSLRAAWLDEKINTREQEQALLDQLLNTPILN